jgi:hypothetical protein
MQKMLASGGITIGAPLAMAAVEWPVTPDARRMDGTWDSDQHSPDQVHLYLTIQEDGTWHEGRFYGSPEAPTRSQVDRHGPDWRFTEEMGPEAEARFHLPPRAEGDDASWGGQLLRLTGAELKLPLRTSKRADAELAKWVSRRQLLLHHVEAQQLQRDRYVTGHSVCRPLDFNPFGRGR